MSNNSFDEIIHKVLMIGGISVLGVLMAILIGVLIKISFFESYTNVKVDTMCVQGHQYNLFYDNGTLKHIEHSPACDCFDFTDIDYD